MVTFNNVETKWLQEIIDNRPQGKILLVGTKADLRRKPGERQSRLSQRNQSTRQKEVNNKVLIFTNMPLSCLKFLCFS